MNIPHKYAVRMINILLLACVLMTGCGGSPQPVRDTDTQNPVLNEADPLQEDQISYRITQTELPVWEDALTEEILKGENWVARQKALYYWGDNLYCLSDLFEIVEEKNIFAGACIQVLAPPYDHWENFGIFYDWGEPPVLRVEALAGVEEDGILLERYSMEDDSYSLTYFGWDGTSELLLEIPEELTGALWYRQDGELLAVSGGGRTLTVFDEAGQQKYRQNLTGRLLGVLEEQKEGISRWYGFEEEELVLWDKPGGQVQAGITDQISPYEDMGIAGSSSGEIFLADINQVWVYEDTGCRELFSFLDADYSIETLYGLHCGENGKLQFLVESEGDPCLLTAEPGTVTEPAEKQEVTIVLNVADSGLQKLAALYNRESQEFHVTVVAAQDAEDAEEYCRRIQMEMIAGRGPDLLGDWVVNTSECVSQGYLEPLDELLEDRGAFLESVLAAGEYEGRQYGVPYACFPYLLAVSNQLTDASSWTLEQMYEAVRNSPAEVLEEGAEGVEIVMTYGLHDEENKQFIDWEEGESHLTEEPFLELLAFAKEYADQGGYPLAEVGERLADGRIAGAQITLFEPGQLLNAWSCFSGEVNYIGYPREAGNGIYMETRKLYLNRNTECREGVLDFLKYLISEEGQLHYMEYGSWLFLPVRSSLMEKCLDRYQQNVTDPPAQHSNDRGIYWQEERLDEAQIEQFLWILDNTVPAVFRSDEIWSMAEEELQPYFSGVISAEEAAAALDSRVQLYLDEQK